MSAPAAPREIRPWYRQLWLQVLISLVLGSLVGHFFPDVGKALKVLGDLFIKIVKMVVAPVIFVTVVKGIAGSKDLGPVGRLAGKALAYFMAVSTLALGFGLTIGNLVKPGSSLHIDPATLDASAVADYADKAHGSTLSSFLLGVVPETLVSALTSGSILQALFVAVLAGIAMAKVGEPARPLVDWIERVGLVVFRLVEVLMSFAPIGAFAAIAFTVGQYGAGTLLQLGGLVLSVMGASALFIVIVLGIISYLHGFSLFRLLAYLKTELLLVFGTSSSEAALPALIERLEEMGCDPVVAGVVVPAGYSFNLDGTNIYMTLAALFIAQAVGIDLQLSDQLVLMAVAMLSSKGAAGVTGAGFITLAATLQMVPSIPVAGMALILGIDRLMSACRSLTNFVGNAVAAMVIARWEGKLDQAALARTIGGGILPQAR